MISPITTSLVNNKEFDNSCQEKTYLICSNWKLLCW